MKNLKQAWVLVILLTLLVTEFMHFTHMLNDTKFIISILNMIAGGVVVLLVFDKGE